MGTRTLSADILPPALPVTRNDSGEWARGYALDRRMRSEKARRDLGWKPTRADIFDAL